MFPLNIPLAILILILELLFGIGFNELVKWANKHKMWHVSISVVAGVAMTLLFPAVILMQVHVVFWQSSVFYFVCFTASGVPMIVGSTRQTVKENHHRRPLPNHVMKTRDDVVMEISAMLDEIVNNKVEVVSVVHRLHQVKGRLKSL